MSPTAKELNVIAGDNVRLKPGTVGQGGNPREVYFVYQAPAPGMDGVYIGEGKLTRKRIIFRPDEDILAEKVT